ncbi:hypothetical protein AB6D78_22325 [Vibrio splendidus]
MGISSICEELNALSKDYKIGQLQRLRKKIKRLSKPKTLKLFSDQTIADEWAFHSGGRTELQFNVGYESRGFRYGVALSLQLSQTLPDISEFEIKIQRFNEFLLAHYSELKHFDMWVYTRDSGRTETFKVTEISSQYFEEGNFIFIGKMSSPDNIDTTQILTVFDQLLPLYEYVESDISLDESVSTVSDGFKFTSGFSSKKSITVGTTCSKSFEIDLKHNELQMHLCTLLSEIYGAENVGDECLTKFGTRVDAVVQTSSGNVFYEIKTASTLKLCIRESIGQLLEYAYWGTEVVPSKVVIVSEHSVTNEAKNYLKKLRNDFGLPIYYQQVVFTDTTLPKMY